jgi:hypothetical protein
VEDGGMSDTIEFYDGEALVCRVESSMIPVIGSKISIRKQVYTIMRVTFALDHADEPREKKMRCNVDLRKVSP